MPDKDFDILIVGGGHAGTEAARIVSRMRMSAGLVTMDRNKIGLMSCNPAIGGVGKGHLVREVDALGGIIGQAADFAGIQFRRLNLSKGPAVRSTRVQCDRRKYTDHISNYVANLPGIEIIEDEAIGIIVANNIINGLILRKIGKIFSRAVILATGTFLGGLIHIGKTQIQSGRRGEPAAIGMTESLNKAGFETRRLKTGTPPRIDSQTIDYDKTESQPGHEPPPYFSHFHAEPPQFNNTDLCYLTYTTPETAALVRDNLNQAPLFSGQIQGTGPRYCPSFEDKVVRFPDKLRHQIFIEPEGLGTTEIYLNGFPTSIPEDIQRKAVRTIIGLNAAVITKPGYAIEYDYLPSHQIRASLETKLVSGLFLAGQINGTSGYEEAAAQGVIAGINACLGIHGESPFIPGRHEAYIGVMLDDLVTRSLTEPYRMFTSRAEYRLALREDNALDRLVPYGKKYGLYIDAELKLITGHNKKVHNATVFLRSTKFKNEFIQKRFNIQTKRGSMSLAELICRPDFDLDYIYDLLENGFKGDRESLEKAIILIKYKGYIGKQDREVEKFRKNENIKIPDSFDFRSLRGLKREAIEKLQKYQPATLGQASRIEGVTPSDIAILMVYLKRK